MYISREIDGYENFIKSKDALMHNTALLAMENDRVMGVLEYRIENNTIVNVSNLELFSKNTIALLAFVEEIEYWNPYIEKIIIGDRSLIELYRESIEKNNFIKKDGVYEYEVENPLELMEIDIKDIKISQLSVCKDKLDKVSKWVNREEDVVVNLTKVDDEIICIDGNTRLVAAYRKGMKKVFGYITEDEYSDFYRRCILWCEKNNINDISDLDRKVVENCDHRKLWINRCEEYFNA